MDARSVALRSEVRTSDTTLVVPVMLGAILVPVDGLELHFVAADSAWGQVKQAPLGCGPPCDWRWLANWCDVHSAMRARALACMWRFRGVLVWVCRVCCAFGLCFQARARARSCFS